MITTLKKLLSLLILYYNAKYGSVVSTQRFIKSLAGKYKVLTISSGEERSNKLVLPTFYIPFAKKIMRKHGMVFTWPNKK